MKNALLIILFCLNAGFLSAQDRNAGTVAFSELNLQNDARTAAMAGAASAMPNGLYGSFTNPAVLGADIENLQVMLGYNLIFDGVWGIPIGVARSFGKYGNLSLNLYSITSGEIENTDEFTGEETGATSRYTFVTGGVSWGYKIGSNLYTGATVKGIFNKLTEYSSDGIALDIGVQYRTTANRFIAAAVIKNLGFMFNGYTESDGRYLLPLTIEAGLSFVPKYIPQLRIALDLNKKTGDYLNIEPGVELDIYKKILLVRLGYAFSTADVQDALKTFSGEEDDSYQKTNWYTLCVGGGLKTAIHNKDVMIDFGLKFRKIVLTPSFVLSALADF